MPGIRDDRGVKLGHLIPAGALLSVTFWSIHRRHRADERRRGPLPTVVKSI